MVAHRERLASMETERKTLVTRQVALASDLSKTNGREKKFPHAISARNRGERERMALGA